MPIQNYGLKWKYNDGPWGRRGKRHAAVDFSNQIGIYVLHQGDRNVYVGRSGKGKKPTIKSRLTHHVKHKSRKWDSFSWFGFKRVNSSGALAKTIMKKIDSHDELIDIEAILIYFLDTKLNKRAGDHRKMLQFHQCEGPDS